MRFFGRTPALMVVEPEGLCWITGRMAEARDGVTWAREFARLPASTAVVRDDGAGLGKGVGLDNARRRDAGLPEIDETLDVFPTLREGGRALRRTWGAAARALDRAAAAQEVIDRRIRRGEPCQGHGRALEPALARGRAGLGSGHGRRGGLGAGAVGVGALHPRGSSERPAAGRGDRSGGVAAPGRRGVGQVAAVAGASRELHVPGPGRRAAGRTGIGRRRPVGVIGPGGAATPALADRQRRRGAGRWSARSKSPSRARIGRSRRAGSGRCSAMPGERAAWWSASTAWRGCSRRATGG